VIEQPGDALADGQLALLESARAVALGPAEPGLLGGVAEVARAPGFDLRHRLVRLSLPAPS
jgi:hypothetical protein